MREYILIASLLVASCAQAAPASGRFEQLDVAISRDGTLTASYREDQGVDVVKSCAFYMSGKINNGRGAVKAWANGSKVLNGQIETRADVVVVSIPGARQFPGCGLVLMPEIETGLELTRTEPAAWTSLARITKPRAKLMVTPAGSSKGAYLIQNDVVGVTGRQGNMLAVEFHSIAGKSSKGWVLTSDTADMLPPR